MKTASPSTNTASPRAPNKTTRLLAMLRREQGASLEEMTEATGWQAHSVRAALTGLRKRGHDVGRQVEGTMTVWKIIEPAA